MKKDVEPHWLYRPDYPNDVPDGHENGCMYAFLGYILAIVICGIITFFTSCSRIEYLEVPVTVHDTVNHTILRIDSVYDRDSIFIERTMRNDTVFETKYVERWHTRDNAIIDTLYIHRTDTVTIPKPIEKKLTRWEEICIKTGHTALIVALLLFLIAVYKLYKKVRARVIKK